MDLLLFVKNFSQQFDETDPQLIDIETEFKKLDEWSSLTALSIIAMVDEEYAVTLTGDEIERSTTVSDLFETVKSKL